MILQLISLWKTDLRSFAHSASNARGPLEHQPAFDPVRLVDWPFSCLHELAITSTSLRHARVSKVLRTTTTQHVEHS